MSGRNRFFAPGLAPFLVLCLALLGGNAHAATLQPFTAQYDARYLGMQATGTMTLAREGADRWKYSLAISNPVANISQTTVFDEYQGRLRPLSGSDRAMALIKRKNVDTVFDWDAGKATWSGDVKPERRGPVALQPGDMDALLINLAVVRDLAAGRPLVYRMVEEGNAREMRWDVVGKEQVTVAGASKEATKLVRRTEKREMFVWVVPGMPVPARVLQRENGADTLELVMRSLN